MAAPVTHTSTTTDQAPTWAEAADAAGGRAVTPPRNYHVPRLRWLGDAADLLEVLGPAQANYGGFP